MHALLLHEGLQLFHDVVIWFLIGSETACLQVRSVQVAATINVNGLFFLLDSTFVKLFRPFVIVLMVGIKERMVNFPGFSFSFYRSYLGFLAL